MINIWKFLIHLFFRTLIKIRVSRPRKEFGLDGHSFIEREAAGESSTEIKITKGNFFTKVKVLEIGLQAANQMKRF